MSPVEALSSLCKHFCIRRKDGALEHDDACLALRQVVSEWVELRMTDGAPLICGATLATWNNDYVCELVVDHDGAHQGHLGGTLNVWEASA